MSVIVPAGLRRAVEGGDGGPAWLDSIPALAARAADRWGLELGAPFETGMAAWTAPATTAAGGDVVLKLSFPHREARGEAAALTAWGGSGAVELLAADASGWALLLCRVRPGTTLRDAVLPPEAHLATGAGLLRRMASVAVPPGQPFDDLAEVADRLAARAAERMAGLLPAAPLAVDPGLCRHAIDLLRTLPAGATRRGLAHGDLNPGNILRDDRPRHGTRGEGEVDPDDHGPDGWVAIDPKPIHGDLAWDPWPLLTQVGPWTTVVPSAAELVDRTRLVADLTGLDAARIAAWCVARGVESGLWAADRGWWTGFRGADGDLARAGAWAEAATRLGG